MIYWETRDENRDNTAMVTVLVGIYGMLTGYFYPCSRPLPFCICLKRSIYSDSHEMTKIGPDLDTILSYSLSVIWFAPATTRILFWDFNLPDFRRFAFINNATTYSGVLFGCILRHLPSSSYCSRVECSRWYIGKSVYRGSLSTLAQCAWQRLCRRLSAFYDSNYYNDHDNPRIDYQDLEDNAGRRSYKLSTNTKTPKCKLRFNDWHWKPRR